MEPRVDAVLLCDSVIRDADTSKATLVGVFTAIWAKEFPALHSPVVVYVVFRDIDKSNRFRVAVVDEGGNEVGGSPEISIEPETPDAPVGIPFRLKGIYVPRPGKYRFQVLIDGKLAGETKFLAQVQTPTPAPSDEQKPQEKAIKP